MGAEQKRAITAVVLSGLILFGWQYFFAPVNDQTAVVKTETSKEIQSNTITNAKPSERVEKVNPSIIEKETFIIKSDSIAYTLTNDLSVVNIESSQATKKFTDVFSNPDNNKILFNLDGTFKPYTFSLSKVSESEFNISSTDLNGKLFIDEKGILNISLTSLKNFKYRFLLTETEEELEGGKYKQFLIASDDLDLITVGSDDSGDKIINWFGLDFNYHLFSIVVDKKPFLYEVKEEGSMQLQENKVVSELNFKYLFAKKEYDHLVSLGNNMELSVDFGIFSILAVPILRGLQWLFSIFPNYGISIILLTIFIRLLTFPLQYKSFKNMKKMQVIQPELTALREKFKDDPQKMQTETMALFKKAGTNPVAGCLPMILQMPIFFAFYRVLYSSVELVDAPFYFWITDLSEKDPYYVLPVLMGIAMFFHQRLTPTTTMDPTQRKIMMFMPLIFCVFMKDFPAGLTLYIVVSTFVAMLQQILVYKRT